MKKGDKQGKIPCTIFSKYHAHKRALPTVMLFSAKMILLLDIFSFIQDFLTFHIH